MSIHHLLDTHAAKMVLIQLTLLLTTQAKGDDRPIRGKLYFAIAASASVQSYSRAFNKTLLNITQNYLAGGGETFRFNLSLETIAIDLPEDGGFSASLLENVCDKIEGKRVVAVLIIGHSAAAFTVSLTAKQAGIPVLWAKEHSQFLPGFRSLESSPLEVHLAPTGQELISALRSLLLQAHWHTFTVLADYASATAMHRPDLKSTLEAPPLKPTLVGLSSPLRAQSLFRKLADISRSTRGVVILMSDRPSAVRILDDAKRLNMMDGHFVWLWIDTAAVISVKNATEDKDGTVERSRRDVDEAPRADFLSRGERKGPRGKPATPRRAPELPSGLLSLKALPIKVDRHLVKGAVKLLFSALRAVVARSPEWMIRNLVSERGNGCWKTRMVKESGFFGEFGRELRSASTNALAGRKISQEIGVDKVDKSLVANFEILNLVPERSIFMNKSESDSPPSSTNLRWKRVGMVSGRSVRLDTIIWPGGDLSVAAVSTRARTVFRIVTALSPPFVMESELDEDGQCLRGLPCHRVLTSDKDNLTLVFNQIKRLEDEEEEQDDDEQDSDYSQSPGDYGEDDEASEDTFFPFQKFKYRTNCCYGLSMDLLENIAQELEFDFTLYIVADGLFGSKVFEPGSRNERDVGKRFLSYKFKEETSKFASGRRKKQESGNGDFIKWNGIVGDLMSGAAHMSFAPLSVSSVRSQVIDFSAPYFYGSVSFLAAPQQRSEIPLMAFLLPFSPELWIAIFTSLNITAIAVAIYEWLSPFGLNPWGRQRSKNFSMSSALWVMWGLLCGHLVAFKAPKSWPNKFLINVWGGFSVIFVASYTANIAALIAGLFFHNTVSNYHDRELLMHRVGAPRSSAAEFYVQKTNPLLWERMRMYSLDNIEEGIEKLRNGSLDILIADTPILDYYRATDHGCKLHKFGEIINEDTYAIGMAKGFPLKDSISAVIAKYSCNGYIDILTEKWYGGLPCFKFATEIAQPRPLGVAAVTGVFILLGVGVILGLLILLVEHLFFRYTLPILRDKPKGSIWRSRNIMFFSQKLYRFINCVELVSPHHAARELVHTIRQGQITSLFQKSIKRKEHEQRRRRKSKAQFFEMIQEIRRQQQEEREPPLESVTEVDCEHQLSPDERKSSSRLSPSIIRRTFMRASPNSAKAKSPTAYFNRQLFSPRSKKAKSSASLNVRRFSTDSVFNSEKQEHSSAVGRRLSRDASAFLTSSPPDINSRRSSYLDIVNSGGRLAGKSPILSIENLSDCSKYSEPLRKLSDSESIGKKLATLPRYQEPTGKDRLQPQYSLTLGKSAEAIAKPDRCEPIATARSFDNVSERNGLLDEEIARRNRQTIQQLQGVIDKKQNEGKASARNNCNPLIRIQVEDTSKAETRHPPLSRKTKTRHQSLGEATGEAGKRSKLGEQSKSLDGAHPTAKSRYRSKLREEDLPPAPPPPNCSPRNSNGKSPLERLSKDELVLLWRSSESELRSHLLKALRDKEEPSDPP